MEAANVRLHLLAAIAHGIETAGALLDDKPFKAKGQGRKRFALALRKLFPQSYSEANQQLDLYGQLRSHMAHCMLPAQTLLITEDRNAPHLSFDGKLLHVSLPVLFNDYCCAIETLLSHIDSGQLTAKRIDFENLKLNRP